MENKPVVLSVFLWLCCCSGFVCAQDATFSLKQAKKEGRLLVGMRGAYNPNRPIDGSTASHFGECIDIRLKNISDSALTILVPSGTWLLSRDSSAQNMLVTGTFRVRLQPKEKKVRRLFAMCGQLRKNAPDVYTRYQAGRQASPELIRLAEVIEANSAQNRAGQYAVWAVTDGAGRRELGDDARVLPQAQQLLDKAFIQINISADENTPAEPGYLSFDFEQASDSLTAEAISVPMEESQSFLLKYRTAKLTDDETGELYLGGIIVAALTVILLVFRFGRPGNLPPGNLS